MIARTKAFISYSHQDEQWRDRLMTHLAILERRGWLHVWTDTRINVGEIWKTEIENALSESRVAVLLISPAFLASTFIWQEEVPRIMKHCKEGMLILPVIARPCAWQLAPDLAQLQARPANGRPLSTGSDAQIDLDLTAFAYELASHLEPLSTDLAAHSWETAERFRHSRLPSDMSTTDQPLPNNGKSPARLPFLNVPLPLSWTGSYLPSQSMQLTIQTVNDDRVQGTLTYLDGETVTVTRIDGRIAKDPRQIARDHIWRRINKVDLRQVECAIEFRETDYEQEGTKEVSFNGKYFGLVSNGTMVGVWAEDSVHGGFALKIDKASNSI